MNKERLKECTEHSAEILKNFELSEIPISNIILKCLRLCRLLGDEDGILLFMYEASGYPQNSSSLLTNEAWRISALAGRHYWVTDKNNKTESKEYANAQLIAELEERISSQKLRLSAAKDPNISLSSANPSQAVFAPRGNSDERAAIVCSINQSQQLIQKVTGRLYDYVLKIYNKLSYGNIVEDTFTSARLQTNEKLGELCPQAIGKFVAVYDNMDSTNPEDWANAVHSCRRILLDLADALYPAQDTPIKVNGREIKIGKDQYVNRLIQFIESKKGSKTYAAIVGADLGSIGKRLDAICNAANKGTHTEISQEEASRYIIHTYLLISDIVSLME